MKNDLNNGECEHGYLDCTSCHSQESLKKRMKELEKPRPSMLTVEEIERLLEDEFGMVESVSFEIGDRDETIMFEDVAQAIHAAQERKAK